MTTKPDPADHAAHDPLLVAAYAAGDATGADLERASALVATCPECARLHRDLRALSASLASAPAPARPRDFRLTAEQAEALRRPAGWQRVLRPFSGTRSAAGPLAASLAALGVAGVLLSGGLNLGSAGVATTALAPAPAASGATSQARGENAYDAAGPGAIGGASIPFAAASGAAGPVTPAATAAAAPAASAEAAPTAGPSAAASAPAVPIAAPSAATASMAPPLATPPAPGSGKAAGQTGANSAAEGSSSGPGASTGPGSSVVAVLVPGGSKPSGATEAPSLQQLATPQAGGPSLLLLGSLGLLAAGIVIGLLRLAARRLL